MNKTHKKSRAASTKAWSLMPQELEAKVELHKRAMLLARSNEQQSNEQTIPYVRFRLGPSELYGISYANLEEIMLVSDITQVPCTPPTIAGVINYRGELLTLIDLKQLFHTEQVEAGNETQVIVVKSDGVRVGIIIDEVDNNDEYNPAYLAPAITSAGVSNIAYVQGIHQGRITILNIGVLLADQALQVEKSVN